ncbi:hypothetical protein [Kingella potus]|uniref:hypothetical protein n=1 Tax=Kingella potus TaxID=265175 RepID=UPI001FD13144|nr:hypothetical protein [Kingella potus]UOP01024.1 hypothetical protein LVJ84_01140 [Kingella potus]
MTTRKTWLFSKTCATAARTALNTAVKFYYAQRQGGTGYVSAMRRMDLGAGEQNILFTLMLRQEGGRWRVFREHAHIQAA